MTELTGDIDPEAADVVLDMLRGAREHARPGLVYVLYMALTRTVRRRSWSRSSRHQRLCGVAIPESSCAPPAAHHPKGAISPPDPARGQRREACRSTADPGPFIRFGRCGAPPWGVQWRDERSSAGRTG
jgi:hypothetical protein